MAAVTWAVGGDKLADVFCNHCRAVFARNVPLGEVQAAKARAEQAHHCTPPKPWRPGVTSASL